MIELGSEIQAHYDEIVTGLSLVVIAMSFRKHVRAEVLERQGGVCDSCGMYVGSALQVHHRKPESWGGSSENIANAVGLCQDCHREIDEETFRGEQYPQVHDDKGYYPQGNK